MVRSLTKSLCSMFSISTTPHGYSRPRTFLPRTSNVCVEPTTANGTDSFPYARIQINVYSWSKYCLFDVACSFIYFELLVLHLELLVLVGVAVGHPVDLNLMIVQLFEYLNIHSCSFKENSNRFVFVVITQGALYTHGCFQTLELDGGERVRLGYDRYDVDFGLQVAHALDVQRLESFLSENKKTTVITLFIHIYICICKATARSPATPRRYEVEAAVGSIVRYVAAVEAALVAEKALELVVNVVNDRLTADVVVVCQIDLTIAFWVVLNSINSGLLSTIRCSWSSRRSRACPRRWGATWRRALRSPLCWPRCASSCDRRCHRCWASGDKRALPFCLCSQTGWFCVGWD